MEKGISQWAERVLGHITARTKGGIWEETRGEVAKALGCSESTVKRALNELKRKGYLEVIAPGGGRGKPTRYRLKLPKDEPVPGPEEKSTPSRDSQVPRPAIPAAKPVQLEPVLDPVLQGDPLLLACREGVRELGQAVFDAFERPVKHPVLYPSLCAGVGGAIGALVGYILGGRNGAAVGGVLGALGGWAYARRRLSALPPQPQLPPPIVPPYPKGDPVGYIVHSLILSQASRLS